MLFYRGYEKSLFSFLCIWYCLLVNYLWCLECLSNCRIGSFCNVIDGRCEQCSGFSCTRDVILDACLCLCVNAFPQHGPYDRQEWCPSKNQTLLNALFKKKISDLEAKVAEKYPLEVWVVPSLLSSAVAVILVLLGQYFGRKAWAWFRKRRDTRPDVKPTKDEEALLAGQSKDSGISIKVQSLRHKEDYMGQEHDQQPHDSMATAPKCTIPLDETEQPRYSGVVMHPVSTKDDSNELRKIHAAPQRGEGMPSERPETDMLNFKYNSRTS